MPDRLPDPLTRERQLDDVIVAYVEAAEAGQAPDRREWLARYPELAAELKAFFADEDQFDSLMAPLRSPAATPAAAKELRSIRLSPSTPPLWESSRRQGDTTRTPADHPSPLFGDYELLGEIARGGMGVVYR